MRGAADLAGAFAFATSIALLCIRRVSAGVRVCALQALLVAIALAASGRGSAVVAPLVFLLNGVILPLLLQRVVASAPSVPSGSVRFWLAAFIVLIVAIAAFHRVGQGNLPTLGALIVLSGLLLAARGSHDLSRMVGLLSSQNGIVLVAGSFSDTPLSTLLVAAMPLVPVLDLTATWLRR